MKFFSARLSVVSLVDDGKTGKTNLWDEVVFVFRAKDFDHAFNRALELGRAQETEYLNFKQQKVRWAFVKVETLDLLGKSIDGKEVSSCLNHRRSKAYIPFDGKFNPEDSQPSQSF